MAAAPPAPRGLDLVAQLNLAGPRSFLLQVEDELDAFAREACAEAEEEGAGGGGPKQLVFPRLARNYEELLVLMALRHGLRSQPLEDRRSSGRRLAVLAAGGGAEGLPLLGLGEFLAAQRPPAGQPGPPKPEASDATGRLRRLRLRRWALGAGGEAKCEGPAEEEEVLREAIDAALRREAEDAGGGRSGAAGSDSDARPRPAGGAAKRGRGFEGQEEAAAEGRQPRHCYRRFGPRAAGRLYLRDSLAKAPWPTARLRRLPDPGVLWRPEWRVGPDGGDMAEGGARGGVLSWAVEPGQFTLGEGFEVSLRAGPGPSEAEAKAQAEAARSRGGASTEPAETDDVNPERDQDDFALSFRRGEGAWHFTAGRRGRAAGGAQKTVPDGGARGRARRQMFWAACAECRADGKHYVVVGPVPGLLTEHFFVAKVGRAEPLSHAGFSYLPHPGKAVFGKVDTQEPPPAIIESITVYPHGLTGDLPFISLRFVEQRPAAAEADEGLLTCAALPAEEGGAEAPLALAVRAAALPAAEAGAERLAGWCRAARRECGLPLPPDEAEEHARRLAKRARLRTEPRPVRQDPSEAPSSWEPRPAELPALGPFDDALRHAPAVWAAKAEEAAAAKDAPKAE